MVITIFSKEERKNIINNAKMHNWCCLRELYGQVGFFLFYTALSILLTFLLTAAQFTPAELVDNVSKKVADDESWETEAGPAFEPAKLAETAPHMTYLQFFTYIFGFG
jgi:hypothetical protein